MERPNLNPSIFDDPDRMPDAAPAISAGTVVRWAKTLFLRIPRTVAVTSVRVLLLRIHPTRRQPDAVMERPSLVGRLLAPVMFRLMFLTLLVLGTVVGIVHAMTHRLPLAGVTQSGPITPGLLAESVPLRAADGAVLQAWHIHAIDEQQVLRHKAVAARAKWPAVVLVADQRSDGHGLDRLVKPLHDRGYVVMVLRLRGSQGETAQTFGLLEQQDISAALANLRSRSYVDRDRISIIGTGTGATAGLLARKYDAGIHRVVAYDPVQSFDDVLAEQVSAAWLRPACRWAFEVLQGVDVEEMNVQSLARTVGRDAVVIRDHGFGPGEIQPAIAGLSQPQELATGAAE